MILTKEELYNFLETAECYGDIVESEYDDCGNYYVTLVYYKDGKTYAVSYLNDKPILKNKEMNVYEILEVKKVIKKVEVWEYV